VAQKESPDRRVEKQANKIKRAKKVRLNKERIFVHKKNNQAAVERETKVKKTDEIIWGEYFFS